MSNLDLKLDRLFESASATSQNVIEEPPFGFTSRVIALWKASGNSDSRELVRLLHRVAATAVAVTLVATVFTYRQISENEEIDEPLINEYAIADSTIQAEFLQ